MIGERDQIQGQVAQTERENLKIYYSCECGKTYDNFPALYLHFQRKHGQKISTKITPEVCQVQENSEEKVLTYFITKRNNLTNLSSKVNDFQSIAKQLKEIFRGFKIDLEKRVVPSQIHLFLQILMIFQNYAEKVLNKNASKELQNFLNDIPFLFNGFVYETMGRQINPNKYPILCDLLLMLSGWLKEKQITDLQVQYVGFYHPHAV